MTKLGTTEDPTLNSNGMVAVEHWFEELKARLP
jgi:hypothetical protein